MQAKYERMLLTEYRKNIEVEAQLKNIIKENAEIKDNTDRKNNIDPINLEFEQANWKWSDAIRRLVCMNNQPFYSYDSYKKYKPEGFILFKKNELSNIRRLTYLTDFKYRNHLKLSKEFYQIVELSGRNINEELEEQKLISLFERYGFIMSSSFNNEATEFAGEIRSAILSGLNDGVRVDDTIKVLKLKYNQNNNLINK